jgi:hypothetical protein
MLRPHAHDIAAALPSIEAQIESEPLRCPYRPASLKVLDVGLLPRSEALRGCPYIPYANSRVVVSECVSAWNKDPIIGVIGVQTGPQ